MAQEVNINIWEDKRCYRKAALSPEEVEYRLRHGYHESQQWDFESKRCEAYLLKPPNKESDSHWFLCYRIAEYLRQFTEKVKMYETNKPDVVFRAGDGRKIAIEVETGTTLKKVPKQLHAKVERLNKEFGNNWFFVVTHKDLYWKYKKLGDTITRKHVQEKLHEYIPPPLY